MHTACSNLRLCNMAKESTSDYLFVDDLYFSALFITDQKEDEDQIQVFPISDALYAEELQLQEVLMAAVISSQMSNNAPPSIIQASQTSSPEPMKVTKEVGESSHSEPLEVAPEEAGQSSHYLCNICMEEKEKNEMFSNEYCHHSFCTDCISKHVEAKIQNNIQVVLCPGLNCKGVLELDACRSVIPSEVMVRWDEAMCESLILPSQKVYCPFKDCSEMLVNDGVEVIREAECPICRRLFCAVCYVPWHSGVECQEFQRLNEDERGREDLMVRELAREQKWNRCPSCRFFVEKTEGCLHMTCRCGFQFCYACGAPWTDTHGGCQPQ